MAKKKKKDASLGKHAAGGSTSAEEKTIADTADQKSDLAKKKKSKPKHASSEADFSDDSNDANQTESPSVEDTDLVDDSSQALPEVAAGELPLNQADAFGGVSYEKPRKSRKVLKVFGIIFASLIGLVLVAYGVGCFFFLDRFWPNTVIGDHDVSLMTSAESAPLLTETADDFQLNVQGQGVEISFSSAELGLKVDGEAISQNAVAEVKPWLWPIEIFNNHDESDKLAASYDRSAINQSIQALVDDFNQTATQPTNANFAFDANTAQFEVVPEELGTALDSAAIMRAIDASVSNLESEVRLDSDELARPFVGAESETLLAACDSANEMLETNLTLSMNGFEVAVLGPALISEWVRLDENMAIAFDEEAYNAWIEGVVWGCNTIGTERTYTRPDGKVVTVAGGSYGWEVDSEALRNQIRDGMNSHQTGTLEIPVIQAGTGFSGLGGQDWGARYCDIDLSEQYARFYDDWGTLIWESPIISGRPDGKHNTPTGVYLLNRKDSPSKLIGEIDPETKKPEYETVVSYWMPFVGNAVGLHDATWQPSFGGGMYANGYGSHGCVNLPYSAAQSLFDIIQLGDPVICHW